MSYAMLAACLWAALAVLLSNLRPRRWAAVRLYALIALGVPILGWLVLSHGPWIGLIGLAAGASVLRWPLAGLWNGMNRRPAEAQGLGASE